MALPAARLNLTTDPHCTAGTLWLAQTGTGEVTTKGPNAGTDTPDGRTGYYRVTVTTAKTTSNTGIYVNDTGCTGVSGDVVTGSMWVRSSYAITISVNTTCRNGSTSVGSTAGGSVVLTPNTWTRLSSTATATGSYTNVQVWAIIPSSSILPAGKTLDGTMLQIEKATAATPYFDGGSTADDNGLYTWKGTANASNSNAEYRGIWVEQKAGAGCPATQITVSGLGNTAGIVQVTRTADNETWTVPAWNARSVVDSDTDPDYATPLGRTVTYTLYFNGQQMDQMAITIPSATGWVQDPYDPTSAMPINTLLTDRSVLTMAKGSLSSRTSTSNASRAIVMGATRPYSIAGQRITEQGVQIALNAFQNTTSDQFKALARASILLFRGLPSWGSLPGLAYLDAPVAEAPYNRDRISGNNALTQWTISGDLITPVSRPPITGKVTNDQVQTNLNGVTNDTIKARSGSKRNIDIKANPLSL